MITEEKTAKQLITEAEDEDIRAGITFIEVAMKALATNLLEAQTTLHEIKKKKQLNSKALQPFLEVALEVEDTCEDVSLALNQFSELAILKIEDF